MNKSAFTPEQLQELEVMYGLVRLKKETLPVRDGLVDRTMSVWWRGKYGPELVVNAGDDWENIEKHPKFYQINKPKVSVKYED